MIRKSLALIGAPLLATAVLVGITGTIRAGDPCGYYGFPGGFGAYYGWGSKNFYPGASYGYHLDDRNPGYYGGLRYREYYAYAMGSYGPGFFLGPIDRYLPPDRWPAHGVYQSHHWIKPVPLAAPPADAAARVPDGPVRLMVRVPADAEVWVDGNPTRQTGPAREFITPPLKGGAEYVLLVRARWTENGQERDQTSTVSVRAGGRFQVAFPTAPDTEAVSAPASAVP
jgi:uncharacterized protein (TIGR03000 family)